MLFRKLSENQMTCPIDRSFESRLVMMRVFVGFAKIFFRLLVERLLASERTEAVGLSPDYLTQRFRDAHKRSFSLIQREKSAFSARFAVSVPILKV